MTLRFLFLGILLSDVIFSCTPDAVTEVTCGSNAISFATDVKPIIDSRCATNSGCHGTGSHNGPGALTTYTQIYQYKNQISSSIRSGEMPRGSSLSSDQKNAVICWIQNGAL